MDLLKKENFPMTSIAKRLVNGIYETTCIGSIGAATGALTGFIYAKLANLPADQVAKALAIWCAVEAALQMLANYLAEGDPTAELVIKISIFSIPAYIGLHELQDRGFIGEKMKIFLIAMRTIIIFGNFFLFISRETEASLAGPKK
jgi:hypothetical protein